MKVRSASCLLVKSASAKCVLPVFATEYFYKVCVKAGGVERGLVNVEKNN